MADKVNSMKVKRFYNTHGPEKTDGIISFFIENFQKIKEKVRIRDEFPTILALIYFSGQIVPMFERGSVNQYRGEFDETTRKRDIYKQIDDLM